MTHNNIQYLTLILYTYSSKKYAEDQKSEILK